MACGQGPKATIKSEQDRGGQLPRRAGCTSVLPRRWAVQLAPVWFKRFGVEAYLQVQPCFINAVE